MLKNQHNLQRTITFKLESKIKKQDTYGITFEIFPLNNFL